MNQITILNTIFRNHCAVFICSSPHTENILRRYIIFCETPFHRLFFICGFRNSKNGEFSFSHFNDFKFLPVLIIIGGMRCLFKIDKIADLKTRQIFTFNRCFIFGMRQIRDFIANEIPRNIVQFIHRQCIFAPEIVEQVNLYASIHSYNRQIIGSTCERNGTLQNIIRPSICIPRSANLILISGEFQEFGQTPAFSGAIIHKFVIKTKYVVSSYDVRIFTLYDLRPFQ